MSGLKDEPHVFKCLQGVGEIRRELMYFFVTVKATESDYQVQFSLNLNSGIGGGSSPGSGP